jgi:hypothetical protein
MILIETYFGTAGNKTYTHVCEYDQAGRFVREYYKVYKR